MLESFYYGNAVSSTNPYFLYFDLTLPYGSDIKLFKDNTILVQYMQNLEYRKTKQDSRFGRMVKGTSYADYAINNKFDLDNNNFIAKKQSSSHYFFTFIFNQQNYGVWKDEKLRFIIY